MKLAWAYRASTRPKKKTHMASPSVSETLSTAGILDDSATGSLDTPVDWDPSEGFLFPPKRTIDCIERKTGLNCIG